MLLFLKDILEKKNITVSQLQKVTGISRSTLTPLSKSSYVPPKTKFETLNRICDALKIPMTQLISFELPTVEILDAKFIPYNAFNEMEQPKELILLKIVLHSQSDIITYLSGFVRYSYPQEFTDQAFEYRVENRSALFENNSMDQTKITEEYLDKQQLKYKRYLNRLTKKYKDKLYVDSVFFTPISETDIQELKKRKDTSIINYLNDSDLTLPNILDSDSYMSIVRDFINKGLLKTNDIDLSQYPKEDQELASEVFFSFLNLDSKGASRYTSILYNRIKNKLSFENRESFSETPIKEYLGIDQDFTS